MRLTHLLTPVFFVLAPLSVSAHEHDDHQHTQSLAAHVHGVATLNIAIDEQLLEMQLESPAMNIVGFEYTPASAADKQAVADAEQALKNAPLLFKLTQQAQCLLTAVSIDNDLTDQADAHEHSAVEDEHHHSDILAHYQFTCTAPDRLKGIDLAGFFKTFPHTEKINVQLITSEIQQGVELSHSNTSLSW